MKSRLIVSALGAATLVAQAALAGTVGYTVTNGTNMTATDLELNFLEEGITVGTSRIFTGFSTAPTDTSSITFSGGKGVAPGGMDTGNVTFKPKGPYTLGSAFWTFPVAQPIQIPLPGVTITGGKKLAAASPTGLEGIMTITNPDSVATLFITMLGLAKDIPASLFDPTDPTFIDNFNIPSGTPVTGFPTMFSLAPDATMNFDLGPVDAADYEAMQFDASTTSFCSTPSVSCVTLGLASDDILPEPASLSLFSVFLAGIWIVRRRKLQRAARECRS